MRRHGLSTILRVGVRSFPLSTIAACVLVTACHVVAAPPARRPPDPLAVLIEHGLPDVREAQRVSVEYSVHVQTYGDPPGPDRKRVTQHAWLVREEPGGRLTLVMDEVRVVYGQRATSAELDERDEQLQPLPAVPQMVLTGLDLRAEIKRVSPARQLRLTPAGNPEAVPEDDLSASETLLFLAHLQQRRQPDIKALLAQALLAKMLPDILESALEVLADAQLENLCDRWIETGDAKEYATGLETLVKQFPRGWENREGVRLLAGHARAAANQPPENEAAALLMTVRAADLAQLPIDRNWLFPPSKAPPPWSEFPKERQLIWGDKTVWAPLTRAEGAAPTPVEKLFERRLSAAELLRPLLNSHRPSRILREREPDGRPNDGDSPKKKGVKLYATLPRTYEIGEIVDRLLQPIVPGNLRYPISDADASRWLNKLAGKSEEAIAWTYLESCQQPNDEPFGLALAVLVEHGAPTSAGRLRNLLRDPMIWSSRLVEQLAPLLPAYLDSLGPERAAFGADLLLALQTGIDSRPQIGTTYTYMSPSAWSGGITWTQEDGARASKLMKLIVDPPTLPGLLSRFLLVEGSEADGVLDALRLQIVGHFDRELEAQIFQTAARLASSQRRMDLLELAGHFGDTLKPGAPMDAATRSAVEKLLADTSGNYYRATGLGDAADMAGHALLHPRMSAAQETLWYTLSDEIEPVGQDWRKVAIAAALAGEALPPVPAGPDLTGNEIATLTADWKELSGPEVLAARRALPLETQVRLIRGLGRQPKWDAALVRAQLTITEVNKDSPEAQRWKGRTFDRKLREELAAVVREGAAQGRNREFLFDARHALSGLSLHVREFEDLAISSRERLALYHLPGLEKRPPDMAARESLTFWRMRGTQTEETDSITPLWKDPAVTEAWLRQYGHPPDPTNASGLGSYQDFRSNPRALAALLSRIKNGDPKLLRAFSFETSASPIVESPKKGE